MREDTFKGDDAELITAIDALLALDASGSLVPHGVGANARTLLSSASTRCLSLLADRARMEKALREAERELAFAVEHMGRKGGGYERALVSVRQALGASQ